MILAWSRLAAFAAMPLALSACDQPAEPPSPESNAALPGIAAEPAATPAIGPPELSAGNAVAVADDPVLPEPFHGRWDASAGACTGTRGEMRLDVGPDRLRFYESAGRVEAVRRRSAEAVEVDLAFEGEGESWTETRLLRLLSDGRLSVETQDGSAERVRCS